MKEPYSEGIAHHTGLESWGGGREASAQALTEEAASPVLSREKSDVGDADAVLLSRRQQRGNQDCARFPVSPVVIDLERAATPFTRNPGDPVAFLADGCQERVGKPGGVTR